MHFIISHFDKMTYKVSHIKLNHPVSRIRNYVFALLSYILSVSVFCLLLLLLLVVVFMKTADFSFSFKNIYTLNKKLC